MRADREGKGGKGPHHPLANEFLTRDGRTRARQSSAFRVNIARMATESRENRVASHTEGRALLDEADCPLDPESDIVRCRSQARVSDELSAIREDLALLGGLR